MLPRFVANKKQENGLHVMSVMDLWAVLGLGVSGFFFLSDPYLVT